MNESLLTDLSALMNNIVQTSLQSQALLAFNNNDYHKNYHLKPIFLYFIQIKWIHDRFRGFLLKLSHAVCDITANKCRPDSNLREGSSEMTSENS